MTNSTFGSNTLSFFIPTTKEEKLSFFQESISNLISSINASTYSQSEKLSLFEEDLVSNYIAPQRNKHIFSVLPENRDNTFFFGPDYVYGSDAIYEQQQVVIINDGGSGCDCKLYWQDLIANN